MQNPYIFPARQPVDDLLDTLMHERTIPRGPTGVLDPRSFDVRLNDRQLGPQLAFNVPSQPQYPVLSDARREEIARVAAQRADAIGVGLGILGPGLGALDAPRPVGLALGLGSKALTNPEIQRSIGKGVANKAEVDARRTVHDAIAGIVWQNFYNSGGLR